MDFNYYSFFLRGEERIFYTYVTLDDQEDILQWALRFNFIQETDMLQCSNVRLLSPEEVKEAGAGVILANTYHLHFQQLYMLIKPLHEESFF